MTPRAWLLLLAAACMGVIAALVWPERTDEVVIVIPERALVDADIDSFKKVCTALAEDREAVRVELPYGWPMLRFATEMSRDAGRITPACERSQVPVADFLAIVVALGKAERIDARMRAWRADEDARIASEDLTARVFEEHGRKPPPLADLDAPPPWWKEIPERDQTSYAVFEIRGPEAVEAWQALMRRPEPGE